MAQRDAKGRFVRADARAANQAREIWTDGECFKSNTRPVLHRQSVSDPHGPRISLGILVCIVLAIALSLAIIAWLLGVRL